MIPTASDLGSKLVSRTNAYQLLSRSLCDPAGWDSALPQSLPLPFDTMADPLPALANELAHSMRAGLEDCGNLRVAYAKLFLGPFQVEAPPYASQYLDPEHQIMGLVSLAVGESYAEAGLGPGPGPRDAPDHITHELEFMYFVGFLAAQSGAAVWERRAREFWQQHLGRWLPEFATRITATGLHPCYVALGRLLAAFAKSEATHFARPADRDAPGSEQTT